MSKPEELAREALVYAAIVASFGLATVLRFRGLYRSEMYSVLVMDRGPPMMWDFDDLPLFQKFACLLLFSCTHLVDEYTRA